MKTNNDPIRYSILTAVSSPEQARREKVSLELQENTARQHAATHGWVESAGPWIIPGESRSIYIDLRDAEMSIPALKRLLDSAQRGDYDILIIYDYSRLRELNDPITRSLAAYGVQVYSTAQPVAPISPYEFRKIRKVTGTASIVQSVNVMTSRLELEQMTRRLRSGIEGRVPKGLHPSGRVPYGYKYAPVDERNDYPYVIDPPAAAVVLTMKDMYLAGKTVKEIIEYLQENNIHAPKGRKVWVDYSVRYLLRNPFYAGEVGIGYYRQIRDPRFNTSKLIKGDPEQINKNTGLHEPLWDAETRQAILNEFSRRSKRYKGQATYRLSLLMRCPQHDHSMYITYLRGIRDDAHRVWYCPAGEKGHWHLFIMDATALELLGKRLMQDLRDIEHLIQTPAAAKDETELLKSAVSDMETRRDRLTDALETGNLMPALYAERVAIIDARIRALHTEIGEKKSALLNQKQRAITLTALAQSIEAAPDYIHLEQPQKVNLQLRRVISHILVHTGDKIEPVYL
jgi:DNA invertase Pin-like site-specific DNA recombinase